MAARPRFVAAGFTFSAIAALAACAGPGSPGSGPPAEAPAYRVGDRWSYRGEDGFRVKTEWDETHELTGIGPEGIAARITLKGGFDVARSELWSTPGQVRVG